MMPHHARGRARGIEHHTIELHRQPRDRTGLCPIPEAGFNGALKVVGQADAFGLQPGHSGHRLVHGPDRAVRLLGHEEGLPPGGRTRIQPDLARVIRFVCQAEMPGQRLRGCILHPEQALLEAGNLLNGSRRMRPDTGRIFWMDMQLQACCPHARLGLLLLRFGGHEPEAQWRSRLACSQDGMGLWQAPVGHKPVVPPRRHIELRHGLRKVCIGRLGVGQHPAQQSIDKASRRLTAQLAGSAHGLVHHDGWVPILALQA